MRIHVLVPLGLKDAIRVLPSLGEDGEVLDRQPLLGHLLDNGLVVEVAACGGDESVGAVAVVDGFVEDVVVGTQDGEGEKVPVLSEEGEEAFEVVLGL